MAQNKHVTLVITHTLLPEQAQRYEQWLGKIMPVAAEFPGRGERDSPGRWQQPVEHHYPLRHA